MTTGELILLLLVLYPTAVALMVIVGGLAVFALRKILKKLGASDDFI
jgi:hypothetical protein